MLSLDYARDDITIANIKSEDGQTREIISKYEKYFFKYVKNGKFVIKNNVKISSNLAQFAINCNTSWKFAKLFCNMTLFDNNSHF